MLPRARTAAVAALALVAATLAAPPAFADRSVAPAGAKVFSSTATSGVEYGGYVYFAADDGVHGNELWRTDGTPAGTSLVKDFNYGNASSHSNPHEITVAGSRLFVRTTSPAELWVFESSGATPKKITYAGSSDSATMGSLQAVGSSLIGIGYTHEVYKHTWFRVPAGSTQATVVRSDVNTTAHPGHTVVHGGYMYFSAAILGDTFQGYELWRTNGTAAGTSMVADVNVGKGSSSPTLVQATDNRVYFIADDGFHGRELWSTDGTSAGTRIVRDHMAGPQHSSIEATTAVGNVLYYVPKDNAYGHELWRTDGTAAGTRIVKDIDPGVAGKQVSLLATAGSKVYYRRGYFEVWVSDGTAAGTKLVREFYPAIHAMHVYGGKVYLEGGQPGWARAIWRTGGTEASTFPLATGGFPVGKAGSTEAFIMGKIGSRVIYTARFHQEAGSPYTPAARKVFYIDQSQSDLPFKVAKAPKVSGKYAPGKRLDATLGTWSPAATTQSLQWLANGKPIAGKTSSWLRLTDAMIGKKISVRVTASTIGAATRTTTTKAKVVKGKLKVTRKTKVKGTARVGKTLTAVKPKFAQKGVKLKYQWYAGSKKIKKATKSKLKLTNKHRGKKISVRITATKKHYTKVTLKSAKTKKIAKKPKKR
ncbi:MAG: hypothetical protein GX593_04170 [Actinomycetales bacterium]|nr:hypothetical protein [Actinomycetales bacterium]